MTESRIAELRALVASQPAYLKLDVTSGLEEALDAIERVRALCQGDDEHDGDFIWSEAILAALEGTK